PAPAGERIKQLDRDLREWLCASPAGTEKRNCPPWRREAGTTPRARAASPPRARRCPLASNQRARWQAHRATDEFSALGALHVAWITNSNSWSCLSRTSTAPKTSTSSNAVSRSMSTTSPVTTSAWCRSPLLGRPVRSPLARVSPPPTPAPTGHPPRRYRHRGRAGPPHLPRRPRQRHPPRDRPRLETWPRPSPHRLRFVRRTQRPRRAKLAAPRTP